MTVNDYWQIKERCVAVWSEAEEREALLERLKVVFRTQVNSARATESITSLRQLLQLLERRDELSEGNVAPLRSIAALLPHDDRLIALLECYREIQPDSYYGNIIDKKRQQIPHSQPTFTNSLINSRKKKLMYETIANEIGSHWRDLARYLDIREGQIQNICKEHSDYSEMTFKVLELSENKSDPQNWFFKLCEALEDARRKDLRKSLQEIIVMNI